MKRVGKLLLLSMSGVLVSCTPGMLDGAVELRDGYFLFDTGGNGRTIEFHEEGRLPRPVISARVDRSASQGTLILVARRPAALVRENGGTVWKMSPECEHWIIDTRSHQVRVTTNESEFGGLTCRP